MSTRLPEHISPLRRYTPEARKAMNDELARLDQRILELTRERQRLRTGFERVSTNALRPEMDSVKNQIELIDVELSSLREYRDRVSHRIEQGYPD